MHECLACGVPLVARAWPRQYDRQRLRAARTGVTVVETAEEAARAASELYHRRASAPYPPAYRNGVDEALNRIESLLS